MRESLLRGNQMTTTNPIPTKQETLLPCPFDGGDEVVIASSSSEGPCVHCFFCDAYVFGDTASECIEKWNTRRAAVAGPRGDVITIAEKVVEYLSGKHLDPETALMEVLPIAEVVAAATASPTGAESEPSAAAPPLCAVHAALDEKDELELEICNDCIACSLNQRSEMLKALESYVPEGEIVDAVDFLKNKLAAPSFEEQQLQTLYDDPHPGYDCGGTCVVHSGKLNAAAPPERTPVAGEQEAETEICPVCKNEVPLDSMYSYNNIPNAFCRQCVDSGKV